MNTNKKIIPYCTGMAMAMIFGLSFLFAKQGLRDLTPMILLSYRFGIAALLMTLLMLCKVIRVSYRGKPVKWLIALSIFYPAIAFVFETTGLKYTQATQAGIMVSLMPIFVMLLGIVILKEFPTFIQKICIALSVIGVGITVVFSKNTGDDGNLLGILLLLISIMAGSVQNVLSRKYSKYFTSIEITYVMVLLGALFFNSIAIIQGILEGNLMQSYGAVFQARSALYAVVYLGVFASVIAFFCMNYTLAKLPAANASVFVNLATVISILAGVFVLKETLYWYQILGGIFIILGVWGTNYFENKKLGG